MVSEYDKKCAKAAEELAAAIRKAGGAWRTYLVAVPTIDEQTPGYLAVIYDNEDVPAGGRIVRPNDNGASTYPGWEWVPYSAHHGIIRAACRREPILSIA